MKKQEIYRAAPVRTRNIFCKIIRNSEKVL